MKRRAAVVCVTTGALCVTASMVLPAVGHADETAGSGFGSFALSATAPAVQFRYDDGANCAARTAGTGGCEGVVPETVATLGNGPVGYALATVAWPGTLAGNLGSLLIVAGGGQVPDQATVLNDPVRAEARTGSGPDTATYDKVPGTTMTASAKDDVVTAAAGIAKGQATPAGTFGNIRSTTAVRLTGPKQATAEAQSTVADLSLAGGLVTIGSVRSTVTALTDGTKATAKGRTLVSDVKIAGVAVTIDEHGVHVQGNGAPLNKTLSDTVNAAIKKAGMTVALSLPTGTPKGGAVDYAAGSLVFAWKTPKGTVTAVLGGAGVSVDAAPGFALSFGSKPFGGGDLGGSAVAGGTVPAAAGGSLPDTAAPPSVAGSGAPSALAPVVAHRGLGLPSPASPAYLVLGLLGAGLVALGLRAASQRLLHAAASTCPLGRNS